MHRFFTGEQCRAGQEVALLEEEAQHALRVLRLSTGDATEIMDGRRVYAAQLTRVDKQAVFARIGEELPTREPQVRVTLFQGLAKGEKMETIIQKCTELGVHAVQPVLFSRCVMRLEGQRADDTRRRWQRIAREAAKQCGRAWVPEIYGPVGVDKLEKLCVRQQLLIVPWEEADGGSVRQLMARWTPDQGTSMGIVIGPEGGITEAEITQLHGMGAQPVTLGPRILRTETAGMATLAAILAMAGEME